MCRGPRLYHEGCSNRDLPHSSSPFTPSRNFSRRQRPVSLPRPRPPRLSPDSRARAAVATFPYASLRTAHESGRSFRGGPVLGCTRLAGWGRRLRSGAEGQA